MRKTALLAYFILIASFIYQPATALAKGGSQTRNPTDGRILLYSTQGDFMGVVNVGALPDMVTFTPSGNIILSANEGEPSDGYQTDPQGSISIITLDRRAEGLVQDVTTLAFDEIDLPQGVRIKPDSIPHHDLEPEYIAVNEEGTRAWVSLQENNALAIVDLVKRKIRNIKPLGAKTFSKIDIDTKDGANPVEAPAHIYGLYQPDTIVSYTVNGKDYVVSANEGDKREYEGWKDYAKVSKLRKEGKSFSHQLSAAILNAKGKRELRVLRDMGKNSPVSYTSLYLAGTRSFSIWDSEGNQLYDSGEDFELYLAKHHADSFNTRINDTKDPVTIALFRKNGKAFEMIGKKAYFWEGVDASSPKKGCEPEALAIAKIHDRVFAYIGLEKQGGFFVYDITSPTAPVMVEYHNDIDYSAPPTASGDLAPEGMVSFHQNGQHYLAIANELSSTVSLYTLAENGKAKKLSSMKTGSFAKGAAESLSYNSGGKNLFVTNNEEKTVDIIDISDPSNPRKTGVIDFSSHGNSAQSVAVKDGIVAIAIK